MTILSKLGLMTVKAHEAVKLQNEGLLRAIKAERQRLKEAFRDIAYQSDVIGELCHDAQKWRDYLKRSRDRKAAKAGVAS